MEDVDEGRAREALLDFFQIYTRRGLDGQRVHHGLLPFGYSYRRLMNNIRAWLKGLENEPEEAAVLLD